MHGLCTDVCIHLCFSGQQQQYECSLDSIIKNCTRICFISLKENAFFPPPFHCQSKKFTWPIADHLSLSKFFYKITIIFAFTSTSLGYLTVLDFKQLISSGNRTSMLAQACWIILSVWLLELML